MKLDLNITPLTSWIPAAPKPVIISGPCSVESEEQLLETAQRLKATQKVHVLRAGIWKPRTRPGEFEGVGKIGLEWLHKAKLATGFLTAVEVANATHVQDALAADVDILWIGARSTVNPFTVQEIADALRGIDIPVMVKNPINPDLSLWIGALERINRAGITKLAAIHRGFSSFEKSTYRNEPMWDLVIQLKTLAPHLPIFNDPSHICGNTTLLPYVAQNALDLDLQGLMIEAHRDPAAAWTDANQQVSPEELAVLLDGLTVRTSASTNTEFTYKLNHIRSAIDRIDDQILQKLGERMSLIAQIGAHKRDNDVTIFQVNRWEEILEKRKALAQALNLEKEFTEKFLELIHIESIRIQTNIMNTPKDS